MTMVPRVPRSVGFDIYALSHLIQQRCSGMDPTLPGMKFIILVGNTECILPTTIHVSSMDFFNRQVSVRSSAKSGD